VVGGVLAKAVQRSGGAVRLHGFTFASNHFHLLVWARGAALVAFMQYLRANLSRKVGHLVDWRGGFWESCASGRDGAGAASPSHPRYASRMARIVFFPLPQFGHTNATFKLARQLHARGHAIHYLLSLPDIVEHVRAQGWGFTSLFEHLFPPGFRDATNVLLGSNAPPAEKRAAALEMQRRLKVHCAEVLFGAAFEARLRECQADLLLVDSTYPLPALTARRLGIPAAILSTTLPLRADDAVPPLTSTAPPPASGWSRLKVRASWLWRANGGRAGYGKFVREQIHELSRRYPELGKLCDFRTHLQHGPHVNLPTLVTCCSEFDFPRTSLENLHYIGPCVDLERADPPLPLEVEQDRRPLLYCSLGSLGFKAAAHRPFFQAVLDAVERRPDWRLLMAVGKNLSAADFRIPPNATVVPFAPQVAVLRRASVMITHGGLNSVKECICLGVPMLVFPTDFDQPGNAARVTHHGLGLMEDIRKVTPETLSSMLDAVMGDASYRARVRAMQEVFLAADASNRGPALVESLLAQRAERGAVRSVVRSV
jgi:zeaxanthin glucosyltransferase